jgi:hypothetical protein
MERLKRDSSSNVQKIKQRQDDIPVVFRVDLRSTQNQKFTDLTMTILTREVESSPSTRGANKN